MSDLIIRDEQSATEHFSQPPLSMQHYLDERDGRLFSEQVSKPPGRYSTAHIVERRGNVIVLEFRDAPRGEATGRRHSRRLRHLCRNGWDAAVLVLLLGTAAACVASFLR